MASNDIPPDLAAYPSRGEPTKIEQGAAGIDWSYWANLAVVDYYDACILSRGFDPRAIKGNAIPRDIEAELRRRESIAKSHLGGDLPSHMTDADRYYEVGKSTGVRLVEFRAWAESLPTPFTFPEGFPRKSCTAPERAEPTDQELARVARMNLWSQAELSGLCSGLLPGAANRSDDELSAVNEANEAIARGTLSGALAFVSRDDADTGARMYGTARHYVPAIAAEWAALQFDAFPAKLLAAVRNRVVVPEPAASTSASEVGLKARERNNLLRIIRALDAMNPKPLPQSGYAESIRAKLDELGLMAVSDDTIRKVVEGARKLDS